MGSPRNFCSPTCLLLNATAPLDSRRARYHRADRLTDATRRLCKNTRGESRTDRAGVALIPTMVGSAAARLYCFAERPHPDNGPRRTRVPERSRLRSPIRPVRKLSRDAHQHLVRASSDDSRSSPPHHPPHLITRTGKGDRTELLGSSSGSDTQACARSCKTSPPAE